MNRGHPAGCPCGQCARDDTCGAICERFRQWYRGNINEARRLLGLAPLEERKNGDEKRVDEQNEPCD